MATTAQWIFDRAMALMDELNESTGKADTADTKEYKNRTLSTLNVLLPECFPCSDTYRATPGKRPICPEVTSMADVVWLDDGVCRGALPYGLAAHLLLMEDPDTANYFQQRYEEKLAQLRTGIPATVENIGDIYGGIGYGQFGRW